MTRSRRFWLVVELLLAAPLLVLGATGPAGRSAKATPASRPPEVVAGCAEPAPPFVTDRAVRQPPALAEPPPRVPYRDPVFGACVVRVTDRHRDLAADDRSRGLKNEYSRVQSFNADESLILVRSIESAWYLYDAASLTPLGQTGFGGSVDPRWDANDPALLYYSDETRLMAYHAVTREQRLVHDFAADLPGERLNAVWTRYEGSPSLDGRYWGLIAQDEDWRAVAFLVYDRWADQVVAKRDVRSMLGIDDGVDFVTISPLGNYFVAAFDRYCERGRPGTDERPCGLMVYNRDLTGGRSLMRIVGHHDIALDAQGREVVVYQDIDTDDIAMLDLATGRVTPLWPIDFSYTSIGLHISGQGVRRPGWALVSTHDADTAAHTWMDDAVFAVELAPRGKVVRLAHTHALVDPEMEHDYWAEPHATTNRDFTRILFTTNWGRSGSEEVEMFLIELPADWSSTLP